MVVDARPPRRDAGRSAAPVIETMSFCFAYPGAHRPAVRDLTFAVAPGEIFGFLGPSGAGKSTTQNVLIRLLDAYEGMISVLGRDLRTWDRSYYRTVRDFPLDGLDVNGEFLNALRAGGVETMHTLETTLEDVFVQVTGRALA
jgi:ABC-type transport system involved in Fe-S cluster assembly fused permease/ATPase subunit